MSFPSCPPSCDNPGCQAGSVGSYPTLGSGGNMCPGGGSWNTGPSTFTDFAHLGYVLGADETMVYYGGFGYGGYPFTIPETATGIELTLLVPSGTFIYPNPASFAYIQFHTDGEDGTPLYPLPFKGIQSLSGSHQYITFGGGSDRLGFTNEDLQMSWNYVFLWWSEYTDYDGFFMRQPILTKFGYHNADSSCQGPVRP